VPQKFNTDRLIEHGEQLAKLDSRIDHIQANLDRLETTTVDLGRALKEIDKQATITGNDMVRLEKKLDRLEIMKSESDRAIKEFDKQTTINGNDLARLEKKFNERDSRGWDIRKLIFAAILTLITGIVIGIVIKPSDKTVPAAAKPEKP
jgi:chromosome segregation ATPase